MQRTRRCLRSLYLAKNVWYMIRKAVVTCQGNFINHTFRSAANYHTYLLGFFLF